MRILALDASGACCSAALLDGGMCVGERRGGDSRRATAALPQMAHDLLDGRAFDAVAVTVGPGSFTGLRGALALAHGLALGASVPVVGVTVAEALRHGVAWDGPIWVALDARRAGLVYLDAGHGMQACSLDALPPALGSVLLLGDAAAVVLAELPSNAVFGPKQQVDAADVGRVALRRLAGELGPCNPQPLYVEAPAARLPA